MHRRAAQRMLAPLLNGLANMIACGTVSAVNAIGPLLRIQAYLLDDEVKDDIEHYETYGFSAHPKPGADVLAVFLNGDRSSGVTVSTPDRRYRPQNLVVGEVVVYDDEGKKIHITRDGIVIDGGGKPVTVKNTPYVRMETGLLEVTGEIVDRCDDIGKSMRLMREKYNTHHHPETGGTTLVPNEQI